MKNFGRRIYFFFFSFKIELNLESEMSERVLSEFSRNPISVEVPAEFHNVKMICSHFDVCRNIRVWCHYADGNKDGNGGENRDASISPRRKTFETRTKSKMKFSQLPVGNSIIQKGICAANIIWANSYKYICII